jgi:hypothetical protein
MSLRFVLDEHYRGPLWRAIQRHNGAGVDLIDATRVGDPPDLPLGSADPDILTWAEREGRVLVTRDRNTMISDFWDHLAAGKHSPGVFLVRRFATLKGLVAMLAFTANAGNADQWRDQLTYMP